VLVLHIRKCQSPVKIRHPQKLLYKNIFYRGLHLTIKISQNQGIDGVFSIEKKLVFFNNVWFVEKFKPGQILHPIGTAYIFLNKSK